MSGILFSIFASCEPLLLSVQATPNNQQANMLKCCINEANATEENPYINSTYPLQQRPQFSWIGIEIWQNVIKTISYVRLSEN